MSILQDNIKRLLDERKANWEARGAQLAEIAETRAFTTPEQGEWDAASSDFDAYSQRIRSLELQLEQERAALDFGGLLRGDHGSSLLELSSPQGPANESTAWRNADTGERAALNPGETLRTHPVFEREHSKQITKEGIAEANYGSLGAMARALATGAGGGSAIVPTTWSANLIDMARNLAAVTQAGATVVPMESGTVKIGRRTADPTVAFRAENSAITPSDPSFDTVTLTAKSIAGIVSTSLEWWQDVDNSEQVIVEALAKAIAQQIDLVALYGGITAGAGAINLPANPNPTGILAALNAQLSANVLGGATNGTVQATPSASGNFWGEVIQTAYKVKRGNENPNALIWNSALAQQYATATDTTGQSLVPPAIVQGLKQLETNRIPSYTQGTMASRASDLFIGDFSQLLVGTRLEIQLRPLNELYAANGQVGVMAYARLDIAPARPTAFSVYRALQAAA